MISRSTASSVVPGLVLALGAGALSMAAAALLGDIIPAASALLVAILLGVAVGNLVALPESTEPGLAVASKQVLRIGIVLLGLQLSLAGIAALGWGVLLLVVAVVASGFLAAELIGRALSVGRGLRTLIGAGFSICGAAAVAGVEGLVDEKEESDVVTALALVVVFGTLMIPLLPALAALFGLGEAATGLWIGASTHEVAQVVAAGGIAGGFALDVAVVVKLTRVAMLAPVAALLSIRVRRRLAANRPRSAGQVNGQVKRPPIIPFFVVGFVIAAAVRATGIVPEVGLEVASWLQTLFLASAMFALGSSVKASTLRSVGGRPVALAALVTLVIGLVGLAGALLLG